MPKLRGSSKAGFLSVGSWVTLRGMSTDLLGFWPSESGFLRSIGAGLSTCCEKQDDEDAGRAALSPGAAGGIPKSGPLGPEVGWSRKLIDEIGLHFEVPRMFIFSFWRMALWLCAFAILRGPFLGMLCFTDSLETHRMARPPSTAATR